MLGSSELNDEIYNLIAMLVFCGKNEETVMIDGEKLFFDDYGNFFDEHDHLLTTKESYILPFRRMLSGMVRTRIAYRDRGKWRIPNLTYLLCKYHHINPAHVVISLE